MPPARINQLRTLLTFAAVLIAITFFLGDTGVYSDDWFCNQRDPSTGDIQDLIMNRPWHPYRPLTRLLLPPIITLLWSHPWALHAISAALHAGIVALIYGVLRRFRVRPSIAAPVCLALMVYPAYFEAVLWNAAICTLLSVVVMLLVWHLYLRWLTTAHSVTSSLRLGMLLLFVGLTYASAALNEQAVGALIALPLAILVLGPARAPTKIRLCIRNSLPFFAIALGAIVYIVGFARHMHRIDGKLARDATGGLSGVMDRAVAIARAVPGEMLLRDLGSGALSDGGAAIAAHPARAFIVCIVLGGLAVLWIGGSRVKQTQCHVESVTPRRYWAILALLGAAWAVGGWLPVVCSYKVTWPRLHYVPSLGLALLIAAACSAILPVNARLPSSACAFIARILRLAFSFSIAISIIMWIGLQSAFQRRTIADAAEAAPLVRTFTGAIEPGTWFVPVRVHSTLPPTGSRRLDSFLRHAWYWQFSSGWRLQSVIRSPSAYTFQTENGVRLWLSEDDPAHFGVVKAPLPRPKAPQGLQLASANRPGEYLLPWDRAVLFNIDALGHTRIVTRLILHPDGQPPIELIPRQIARSPSAPLLPPHTLDIYPARDAPIAPHQEPSSHTPPHTFPRTDPRAVQLASETGTLSPPPDKTRPPPP